MLTYRRHPWGRRTRLVPLCVLAGLLVLSSVLQAQERRYRLELGAGGFTQSYDSVTNLRSAWGGIGRVGLWLPHNFSVELEGALAGPKTTDTRIDVKIRSLVGSVLYNIPLGNAAWGHLRVGGGRTKFDPGFRCPSSPSVVTTICGSGSTLLAGGGLRVAVLPTVMIRGDVALVRNQTGVDTVPHFTNVGVSLGLSYMLGSEPIPDSDNDGVLENRDRCPDTPTGAQVDGTGCPSDSDADGVPDGVDRCANTPLGASVNGAGCTRDSDGDNIPDGVDRCPDTESGVLVDPNGCPKDSDGDSIPDGLDRCSETPRGATVDALGCPGDEDGDGVLDGLDRCPRTAPGAAINSSGCSTRQGAAAPQRAAPPQPAPAPPRGRADTAAAAAPPPGRAPVRGRLVAGVLPGVAFAPGSARLRPESFVTLDSIAQILQADTALRVEIGAHTNNTGTPSQDQHLTDLQADAVRTYLVTKGVNFQQVQARGYGSTFPLTPDNTPRGRLANRRVELKPVLPGP
jgi:outer membrane protein OmpA-like peptidoglycan-associated protein